ncbi:MAG TPA: long-chain-fatty-acid--CoA ligase [Rhodopila sp.]
MSEFGEAAALADWFRIQARMQPRAPALTYLDRVTTRAGFDRHASMVANGLTALGVTRQERIGYIGKNSDLYFELLAGSFKANVVLVPVNWRLAPPEAAAILRDAGVGVLFVGPGFTAMALSLEAEGYAARHAFSMDSASSDGRDLDGADASGWPDFATWRDAQTDTDPQVAIDPADTAMQVYTSGTTGLPKGVELSNANILAFLKDYRTGCLRGLGPSDVVLICMPVFHVAGSFIGLASLALGCSGIVMPEVNVDSLLGLIPRHQVTFVFLVPAVVLALVQHTEAARTEFSSLRRLVYGASPIADDTLLRARALLPGVAFWQVYGATETSATGTTLPPEHHQGGMLRSCGRPYPGVGVRVVDASGEDVPAGDVGEIVMRAEAVMKGYWKQAEATRAAFFPGGWLRTGDAGYFDADGLLYIHDRVKDMIITGAENVYPAEVENVLFGHPAVADAAVIGVPDERWGEAVKAIVVPKPGQVPTEAEIIRFVRGRIAGFKTPKSVDFVAALPRNPSGKVLRRQLRAPYWAGRTRNVG